MSIRVFDKRPHWDDLKELVRPEVKSIEEFNVRVARGIDQARNFLGREHNKIALSADRIGAVHRYIFKEVFAWAGEFRKTGQVRDLSGNVAFGLDGKYRGAPWGEIRSELENVRKASERTFSEGRGMSDEFQKPERISKLASGIAQFHANVLGVQPFLEGTQPVADLLLDQHTGVIFGREISKGFNRHQYHLAVERAHAVGDIRPLRDLILEECRLLRDVRQGEMEQHCRAASDMAKTALDKVWHDLAR